MSVLFKDFDAERIGYVPPGLHLPWADALDRLHEEASVLWDRDMGAFVFPAAWPEDSFIEVCKSTDTIDKVQSYGEVIFNGGFARLVKHLDQSDLSWIIIRNNKDDITKAYYIFYEKPLPESLR